MEMRCTTCGVRTGDWSTCEEHGFTPRYYALWGHEWAAVAWMQGAVLECLTLIELNMPEDAHASESAVRTEIAQWSTPYERRT